MIELTKIGTDNLQHHRENFLKGIQQKKHETGILLETCNRVEWYSGEGQISSEITKHLFRVVSGLDSSIIGETAIVGQVKNAYQEATLKGSLDKNLHKLFQTALFVGKRVRTETGISKGAMSHSLAAVNLLLAKVKSVKNLNITIIGANALNEKIIKFLMKKEASTIFIGNRTFDKAQQLALKYNSKAVRFNQLHEILENTDVLISATSAPHFILKYESFKSNKQLLIFDLAVPRDIDPKIGDLPQVSLYDIEEIEKHINSNVRVRNEKVVLAEKIIEKEVQLFSKNYGNK